MHELSIAMSILDGVEEEMQRHAGRCVEAVHVRIGPLSGVVKESLASAYELAREATPFAASYLVFEDAPVTVLCAYCQAERLVQSLDRFCCAECATPATNIVHGRELEITALELRE